MSVPWWGRETGNVRYLLPAAALRGRERRTAWTALFTNPMKNMRRPGAEREGTHGPRLENASRDRADGERCSQSKQRDEERCLFREIEEVAKKRRRELTLTARLGRRDKRGSPVEPQAIDMAWVLPCRSVGARAAPNVFANEFNNVFGTVRDLMSLEPLP